MVLEKVFRRLKNKDYCRYETNANYHGFIDDRLEDIIVPELLEVFSLRRQEFISVAYFGTERTRFSYYGLDIKMALETLADLRLPNSWPNNLGEKVFFEIKWDFEKRVKEGKCGEFFWVCRFNHGWEHQLRFAFNKLIDLYVKDSMQSENETSRVVFVDMLRNCYAQKS